MHWFHKFILSWNSTCFGQFLCSSSGVYSVYTQQWYMSYRFVDSSRVVPSWSCLRAVYKSVWHNPLLSVQWINSWWWTDELSKTCRVSWQNKFVKLMLLVGFMTKKFVSWVLAVDSSNYLLKFTNTLCRFLPRANFTCLYMNWILSPLLFKSSPHTQNVSSMLRSLKSITNYFDILLPFCFKVCWVKSVISDISVIPSFVIWSENMEPGGCVLNFFFPGSTTPSRPRPLHCQGFTITLRHTTLVRTPLGEWSVHHGDLYLITQHS
jgi:hypothetical protein